MKKLQILVPQYKEDEDIVENLLDSINIQQGINFDDIEVIIMNDGSDVKLDSDFLNYYKYNIVYIQNKHLGICGTRNALMKAATAPFIMFCDSDDMFVSSLALYYIFNEIDNKPFDLLVSPFMEETKAYTLDQQGNKVIIDKKIFIEKGNMKTEGIDGTFIHGKVYRRQYLIDNNITWNEKLKVNEDSFFNGLCINLSNKVLYMPNPYYLYKWRDGSVSKDCANHKLLNYQYFFLSESELIDQLLSRSLIDKAKAYIAILIYDGYYFFNTIENSDPEHYNYLKQEYKNYYLKYKETFDTIDIKLLTDVADKMKKKYTFRQAPIEIKDDFTTWLNKEILTNEQ